MKSFLVDVPVRVTIWIRPDCQRKQFEVLKLARPSILFLQSDGGRNDCEWEAIRKNREMFENEIDWECTVYKIYEDKNIGLYSMGKKCSCFIWEKVDRCIFLEDDQVPSVSFFQYCAELLEKYKDDYRISCICGMNHLGKCDDVTSDYFFSRQGSIWGMAYWKRTYESRRSCFKYADDPYIMNLLDQRTRHNKIFKKRYIAYSKQTHYEGHVPGGEFFHEFAMYGYNQLQIIPKVNLISNIGCTVDATHSDSLHLMPRGLRKVYNMETYEMTFPLEHANYVIPDVQYEKKRNRIMAYNYPFIFVCRKIERVILLCIHGQIFKNIIKKIKRKNKLET